MPRAFEARTQRLLRAAREHKPAIRWTMLEQTGDGSWIDCATREVAPPPVEDDRRRLILVTLARREDGA